MKILGTYKRLLQLLELHKAFLNVPTFKDLRSLKTVLTGSLVLEIRLENKIRDLDVVFYKELNLCK